MPDPALPRLEPVGSAAGGPAVVLVLHGGRSTSLESGQRRRLTYWRMLPFAHDLAAAGLPVFLLRYRVRGWNAPVRDALRDAQWALAELDRRFPGVPVVLVGHSMGGRAALAAAGAPNATAVCALAPWLDGSDPVRQLAGRTVLIAHGDRERWTDPAQSYAYAVRAKAVTGRIARFTVPGAGHFMITRARDWAALVRRFVLGAAGIEPMDPRITNAFTQPSPAGLAIPLASTDRSGAAR
ncbi:alpha/beta hydrolase [Pseudonocardia sp. CA-107938]|uniref:alpha/beta hydrolase n=1 Tax=Pseudonocardia sp. CA-107938 TaxID=3240021 RepID=UPI003D905C81